jgi:ligand-binding SRPBCC domain-containing protein
MPEFTTEITLAQPIERVFAFFSDAANLERITPPELAFHIVSPRPIAMHEGTLIDYRLKLLGVPFGWRTRIAAWDPPHRFVDDQIRGPYKVWIHTHTFEAVAAGTRMRDHVRYALPLAPFGNLALPIVRRQLGRIFEYRRQAMSNVFGDTQS